MVWLIAGLCTQKHVVYELIFTSGEKITQNRMSLSKHRLCLYMYCDASELSFKLNVIVTAAAHFHCDYHRSGEDEQDLRLHSTFDSRNPIISDSIIN